MVRSHPPDDVLLQLGFGVVDEVLHYLPQGDGDGHEHKDSTDEPGNGEAIHPVQVLRYTRKVNTDGDAAKNPQSRMVRKMPDIAWRGKY